MADAAPSAPTSEYLSTLEKGLRVLTAFSRDCPQMTLSEVARVTQLNPAVARRCLLTLTELGYVGKVDGLFSLRPAVLELSRPFTESFDIDNLIRPSLQRLRDETGDSASFALLSGSDVLYLSHVSTYRVIRLQASAGTRFPALATSLGRAILSVMPPGDVDAFLFKYPVEQRTEHTLTDTGALRDAIQHARHQGYAMVSDELDYGITSIAAPIVIPGRGPVGAVNSSAATTRIDVKNFAESRLPSLLAVRDSLTAELSRSPELVRAIQTSGY